MEITALSTSLVLKHLDDLKLLKMLYKCTLFPIISSDLRKFKEAKKQFDKVSEEKENALVKNAQIQRNKQHEVEEATNILTATRKCFRHIALDYVLQVRLQSQCNSLK